MMSKDAGTPPRAQSDEAYLRLEELIVTLELEPGASITEGALIERVGLGRTPVREAVQRLALEGFLIVRPRAGLAIAPLRPEDWPKVLDARRGVETVLARSAARNLGEEAALKFQSAAKAMQAAVTAGDKRAFLAADKSFDAALGLAAGNLFAERLAAPLQTHSRRFWYASATEGDLAPAARSHLGVIEAIINRVEAEAEARTLALMTMLDAMAARTSG